MTHRTIDPVGPAPAPRTVDITPTWTTIVPILLAVLENNALQGRAAAEAELRRMAKLADLYVASQKGE